MSADIDADAVAELLVEARQLLYRISCDLGPSLGKAGIIPTGAVADLVDLADRVHAEANSIHQHLRRVAQIKAEGNGGTLVSPTGLVGWRGGGRAVSDQFPEEPVAGITDDEVEDFLSTIGKASEVKRPRGPSMSDEMYPEQRMEMVATRLRSEVEQHTEVTDPYDDFGWGYIAGLKRALLLLSKQEVDR